MTLDTVVVRSGGRKEKFTSPIISDAIITYIKLRYINV